MQYYPYTQMKYRFVGEKTCSVWRVLSQHLLLLVFAVTLLLPVSAMGSTKTEFGKVSWYGGKFHGRKTASGVRYDKNAFTAAHKYIPFGTVVRVYSLGTGKNVLVEVNDRGPYAKGRVVDVSQKAAQVLQLIKPGVTSAALEVISSVDGRPLNPDNAFYIPLSDILPAAQAQKKYAELLAKLSGASLQVLSSPVMSQQKGMVCLGPFTTFKAARAACSSLPHLELEPTIIEANQRAKIFLQPKPPQQQKNSITADVVNKNKRIAKGTGKQNKRIHAAGNQRTSIKTVTPKRRQATVYSSSIAALP